MKSENKGYPKKYSIETENNQKYSKTDMKESEMNIPSHFKREETQSSEINTTTKVTECGEKRTLQNNEKFAIFGAESIVERIEIKNLKEGEKISLST